MRRGPAPRFDHDEARRRHAAGEKTAALADEFGVTVNAVWRVVSPMGLATYKRAQDAYYERHRVPCESCGKPCLDLGIKGKAVNNVDGRTICLRCRADLKRERLLFDDDGLLVAVRCQQVDCANGERWQTPEHFTNGQRHREVRAGGIHGSCRACQTRARRRYRARHRAQENAYQRGYKRRRRAEKAGA